MIDAVFGIALSGGGHKGLAHAGILQFLDEKDISPQIISGTSAGALIGTLYANGRKPLEILELFQSISFFNWNYLTTKKAGLFDIDRLEIYLDKELGNKTIGELDKKVYITATDMQRGKLKIFNNDTIAKKAVLASCAFPAVFSPVLIDNVIYSDGGILNNFPVNIIQGHCDFIIGSNVNPVIDTTSENLKTIKSITLRSFEIMMSNNAHMHKNLCDWYLEPALLHKYFTFETSKIKMKEIFEIGYNEAKSRFSTFEDNLK